MLRAERPRARTWPRHVLVHVVGPVSLAFTIGLLAVLRTYRKESEYLSV